MELWMWVVLGMIVLALVVAMVATVALLLQRRRTDGLRDRFGPEYDRASDRADDRADAEAELSARRERRDRLEVRPLAGVARERYANAWLQVQARFVDEAPTALRDADALVRDVMRERGYPMDRFDQMAADISVDHPDLVEHYREGHRISIATKDGGADTEEMRRAVVHYRALFEELLEDRGRNTEPWAG